MVRGQVQITVLSSLTLQCSLLRTSFSRVWPPPPLQSAPERQALHDPLILKYLWRDSGVLVSPTHFADFPLPVLLRCLRLLVGATRGASHPRQPFDGSVCAIHPGRYRAYPAMQASQELAPVADVVRPTLSSHLRQLVCPELAL